MGLTAPINVHCPEALIFYHPTTHLLFLCRYLAAVRQPSWVVHQAGPHHWLQRGVSSAVAPSVVPGGIVTLC